MPFATWGVFFVAIMGAALAIQLILLPYVFPRWHAGNGLLVGGDWVTFHKQAVELAQKIHEQGWSVWELRPGAQAPVGIAAAIYTLTVPQPWVLVPLNALLHVATGYVLFRIVQFFLPNGRLAIWCVVPFLCYPSAATWYAQIHKDGFSIAGVMLILYGWLSLANGAAWQDREWHGMLRAFLLIIIGGILVWLVRPYMITLLQIAGGGVALLLTVSAALRFRSRWRKPFKFLVGTCGMWLLVGASGMFSLGGGEVGQQIHIEQQTHVGKQARIGPSLSGFIAGKLQVLASTRDAFRMTPGGSNIDSEIGLNDAETLGLYLPRAAQIAFLSPFPTQWFGQGSLEANTVMRRIAGLEMLGVYFSLAMLPIAFAFWRKTIELWIIFLYCVPILLVYGIVFANVGTLYRMRYGFLMVLVALGLAGGMKLFYRFRGGD